MSEESSDRRMTELQEKIAFVERDVEQLDSVVLEMSQRMDRMQRELNAVRDQLRNVQTSIEERDSEDESDAGADV